jgi:hypothetical protein
LKNQSACTITSHDISPVFVWSTAKATVFYLPYIATVPIVGAPETENGFCHGHL